MVMALLQHVQTLLPDKYKRRRLIARTLEDILPYFFKFKDNPQPQGKHLGSGLKQYQFVQTADIPFVYSTIALAVKLLKTNDHLSKEEINAFYTLFPWPEDNKPKARQCFYEAYRDTAEAKYYARKIVTYCENDLHLLLEVLIALIQLANTDNTINQDEWQFLTHIADIFDVEEPSLHTLLRWCLLPQEEDPYALLGLDTPHSQKDVKQAYRRAVKDCHPDTLSGLSVPTAIQHILAEKFSLLTHAYESICKKKKWK